MRLLSAIGHSALLEQFLVFGCDADRTAFVTAPLPNECAQLGCRWNSRSCDSSVIKLGFDILLIYGRQEIAGEFPLFGLFVLLLRIASGACRLNPIYSSGMVESLSD